MDCGDKCAKMLLFIFNLITFLSGIAILVIGIVMVVQKPDYASLIGYEVFNICIALIVVGCVVTIVSFFGCCGAIKENTCLLYTFSILLAIVFLAELAGCIVAFVYQDDIKSDLQSDMMNNMPDCKDGNTDQDSLCQEWFNMQDDLDCCGAANYSDWKGHFPDSEHGALPQTCCPSSMACDTSNAYPGCVGAAYDKVSPYVWIIAGVCLGVAVIQIFLVAISCWLITTLKKEYRAVPVRPWK